MANTKTSLVMAGLMVLTLLAGCGKEGGAPAAGASPRMKMTTEIPKSITTPEYTWIRERKAEPY